SPEGRCHALALATPGGFSPVLGDLGDLVRGGDESQVFEQLATTHEPHRKHDRIHDRGDGESTPERPRDGYDAGREERHRNGEHYCLADPPRHLTEPARGLLERPRVHRLKLY